jgi:hypothetical protein
MIAMEKAAESGELNQTERWGRSLGDSSWMVEKLRFMLADPETLQRTEGHQTSPKVSSE